MPDDFVCALRDAAPLVRLLHTITSEWSAPRQRKGKPIAAATARALLCDFEGSPCPLFEGPIPFLVGFAAHQQNLAIKRPLAVHASTGANMHRILSTAINVSNGGNIIHTSHENVDVLLLPAGASLPPRVNARVILVLATESTAAPPQPSLTAEQWSGHIAALSTPRANASYFLLPHDAAAASTLSAGNRAAAAAAKPRRGGRAPSPPATHAAALIWQSTSCPPLPLWDLGRPVRFATPAEAASAASAVSAGFPYSEWFACATIEVLRPLVRSLFRLPRRKGKSVWATCFGREVARVDSPCYWFSGMHMRGEHFVTQVLSSPDVLLSRLSAHRAATLELLGAAAPPPSHSPAHPTPERSTPLSPSSALPPPRAWPPLLLLDPAAGEGNYTQHLPDGMGRMPALELVSNHGWSAVRLAPSSNRRPALSPYVCARAARLRCYWWPTVDALRTILFTVQSCYNSLPKPHPQVLAEPEPETHTWLARHFARFLPSGRVTLLTDGVTHEAAAVSFHGRQTRDLLVASVLAASVLAASFACHAATPADVTRV